MIRRKAILREWEPTAVEEGLALGELRMREYLTRRRVKRALRDLGDTSAQVHDHLRDLGVRGQRGSATMCPVACYLRTLPGVDTVAVSSQGVCVNGIRDTSVPPAVGDFIRTFDSSCRAYRDLVETWM